MRTHNDCIPCLIRHANELAVENLPSRARGAFVNDILKRLDLFDFDQAPPLFAMEMYRVLKSMAGAEDPYAGRKEVSNKKAFALYPGLKEIISASDDPLDTALRIAVAGNIIDFGIDGDGDNRIEATIRASLQATFAFDDTEELKDRLRSAASILYIADNAGEIIMDRLFIEQIGPERVTCAVRAAPIINDATLFDAAQSGLDGVCTVIASGSQASGSPLSLCSDEFKELFCRADVVVSKGQGNFETVTDTGREVFHLMMVKCAVISREVGAPLGSFIALKRR